MEITLQANRIFNDVNKSRARYLVLKGSAGSGKSVDSARQYIVRLMRDRGRNLLAMRKSEVTNRDSTFAELQSAIYSMGVSAYWKIIQSPLELRCVNGNKVIFRGMNDARQREKLKSITFSQGKLTDIWLEEATEFAQSDVEILDDRLRGELPGGLFYQMRLTFNPVSSSHWIKKVYFDREDPNVFTHHSTYLDNRFNDAAFHDRMMRRKEIDPEGYRIYGLGEWGEIGGLILKKYKIHDFKTKEEFFDAMYIGQDFGYNHANAILLLGWKDGELYICQEIYVHEMDTAQIIELADKKILPKHIHMFCDSAEPDRIAMWRRAGYWATGVNKASNSVNAQIDFLKQVKIHIHPSCINTIKEIQQWKWQQDSKSNEYLDEPVNVFDDAMAALRYGVEQIRPKRGGGGKMVNVTGV